MRVCVCVERDTDNIGLHTVRLARLLTIHLSDERLLSGCHYTGTPLVQDTMFFLVTLYQFAIEVLPPSELDDESCQFSLPLLTTSLRTGDTTFKQTCV